MKWIDSEDIVLIHEQVIRASGGIPGVINPGALDSCINRPLTRLGGLDMFPELNDKIAALIHSIIQFHPFADGNKRTALVAADVCLRLNSRRIKPLPENEAFFWAIARGEKDIKDINEWLISSVEKWDE